MELDSNRPDGPLATEEFDLQLRADIHATGWQTALGRPPKINLLELSPQAPAPKCVSITIARQRIKTHSFTFPESPAWTAAKKTGNTASPAAKPSQPAASAGEKKKFTRIAPPSDIVKLEDRLYYMLQPPLESILSTGELEFPFPPFPYQYEGIAFLYPRYSAVLADEMGLGKTMQAITTIRMLLHAGEVRQVLLICPKPLVTNWQREFRQWAEEVPVTIIEGDRTRRQWLWSLTDAPVKIANYELLMRDREVFEEVDQRFDLVVLDEAQRIKNRNSTTSQVVRSISRTRNWALTGTPVENSPEDLVGIFEFLSPGYITSDMTPRRMGMAAKDHVLRRTKDLVLTDLPPKMFRDAELDLLPAQRETYQMAEDEGIVRLNDLGGELTVQHVFELVLRLKQICNFDPATGESGKLERLEADLEEVAASGRKAIVFSQWVETIKRISKRLERFNPLEYHGKIPSKQRDGIIDQFKHDPKHSLILMSYGAGSVGLNLQFCEYVFLFDRWWNPAVEDQAVNRAHRIGAAGPVTVTRFLMLDTIEQRINEVLEQKRELFDTIFSETGAPASNGFTQAEIFGLFQLRTPAGPIRHAA